jgi:hypothetical protein
MPGDAAQEALRIGCRVFPHLKTQEVIDRLVLTGLYAMKQPPWSPPNFHGTDRDAWELPPPLNIGSPGKPS